MQIIIEGVDASGKSTLGEIIGRTLGYPVVESEGPPKYAGEINHRMERYLAMPKAVFVRHPAVSQVIYGRMRHDSEPMSNELILQTYDKCKLFIYCDPIDRGLAGHAVKDGEDPDHVRQLTENYERLLRLYREWAIRQAAVIYRIGDPLQRVIDICSTIR